MNAGAEIESAVDDLIYILKNSPEEFVLNYSGESSPLEIEFVYEPSGINANIKNYPNKKLVI